MSKKKTQKRRQNHQVITTNYTKLDHCEKKIEAKTLDKNVNKVESEEGRRLYI
jgi:hypothetical protein